MSRCAKHSHWIMSFPMNAPRVPFFALGTHLLTDALARLILSDSFIRIHRRCARSISIFTKERIEQSVRATSFSALNYNRGHSIENFRNEESWSCGESGREEARTEQNASVVYRKTMCAGSARRAGGYLHLQSCIGARR